MYDCFSISRYIKGGKKITSLDTIEFLEIHVCINNPYWKSSGIIIFLCKYYIVISNLLFQIHWYALSCMFSFCCSLQYYQNFMRNQYGIKIKLQKKADKIICVRSINFLIARPLFIIYYFICLLPPPSQVINLLNRPYKNVWFCHGWCSVWW